MRTNLGALILRVRIRNHGEDFVGSIFVAINTPTIVVVVVVVIAIVIATSTPPDGSYGGEKTKVYSHVRDEQVGHSLVHPKTHAVNTHHLMELQTERRRKSVYLAVGIADTLLEPCHQARRTRSVP